MKLIASGIWVRVRHYLVLGAPMLASRTATALHSLPSFATLRHFFPLCALIVDSFANMSSGILLEMENICGFSEPREEFLWSLQRKPQLLGEVAINIHSASPHVAEKNSKMFCNSKHSCKIFLTRGCPAPLLCWFRGWGKPEAWLGQPRSHFCGSTVNAFCAADGEVAMRRTTRQLSAHAIRRRSLGWTQASCRALLTSVTIAAAVGSVRPPANVVGTPRASASTR